MSSWNPKNWKINTTILVERWSTYPSCCGINFPEGVKDPAQHSREQPNLIKIAPVAGT